MRYFTNSEIQCFKRCRRRWWLSYHRRLRLKARNMTGAAPLGTRVHQALEPWYQPEHITRKDPRNVLEDILHQDKVALIESWTGEPENLDGVLKQFDKEAELSRAMIEGYMQWLEETGADSDFEVIASESAVEYEFAPGLSLAGRLDIRVRRRHDGALYFLDTKTCQNFIDMERQLPQSEQLMLYEILLRMTHPGERTAGAQFNLIRKVRRTGTAKPPFYQRAEVHYNEHQLRSAWYRIMGVVRDIQQVEAALATEPEHPENIVYPDPRSDCNWSCEFFFCCQQFDDGSRVEDLIQSLFEVTDPLDRYPELRGESDDA